MNIPRIYTIPSKSFFLFGPRGVGKSTWVNSSRKFNLALDLLNQKTFLDLQRDPSLLEARAAGLKNGDTVFIDEVQKLPELLNEVHRIMENKKINFILTGSSARKLKRSGANLLAGRAHNYKMYPFSLRELGDNINLKQILNVGTLPIVHTNLQLAEETLYSYVETYLREEIKEEAIVRRVEEFSRFLTIAGHLNAQVLNLENVSRETGKSNKTVQSWYQILEETLLGTRVPAYRPGFKVREVEHPKFYWFDCGVARVAGGLSVSDVDKFWYGFAFETLILNELLIYKEISRKRNDIHYYATPGAGEIDFLVETRKKTINRSSEFITIEVKYSDKWVRDFESSSRALKQFAKESHKRMIGVYIGKEVLTFDDFEVLPLPVFVSRLFKGEIF